MHVLLLNTDLGYGGAEKMMVFVANALAAAGIKTTFLTYRDYEKVYQKLDQRVKHEHLELESTGRSIHAVLSSTVKIRRYLIDNKVDLAIAFLFPSQLRLALARKFMKTKILFSERSDPSLVGTGMKARCFNYLWKRLFSSADGFVFQTRRARDFYPKRVQSKSVVIANPIRQLHRTCPRNKETVERSIVCVARLENKQKRQDLLIEAFNMLSDRYPSYKLKLFGDGPDAEWLAERAKGNPNIEFCGVTGNVVEAVQNAAMFVLASDYEGIPNALLEAMSLGVPCIATDCSPGGAAMLLDDGIYGLLVERGNAEALCSAMVKYLENPEVSEAYGEKGMSVNTRFDPNVIAKKWISFIQGEH